MSTAPQDPRGKVELAPWAFVAMVAIIALAWLARCAGLTPTN